MTQLARLALFSACAWLAAGAAAAQPPVWVAHRGQATVILFGSVHILPPAMDWEPPALKSALANAADLWFEIPLDPASTATASRLAYERGLQPEGSKLSDQLSPKGRERLAKVAKRAGVSLDGLERLKPWLAEITLSLAVYAQAHAAADQGVERQIDAVTPQAVPRRALETTEQQIGYLSDAPLPDQVASLEETLGELSDGPQSYEKVVEAWMAGDARGLVREALRPMMKEAPGEYRSLVVARNERWVDEISDRLNGSGEAVMVVGVGHLVGPDSVPALLRARGISVEGP
ncbi:MAG TPA: TraB/GumN family protein [Caulobacteraceae bacterium]|nr:TraB/GumN family protein [Caulobacteraceae bacterium]